MHRFMHGVYLSLVSVLHFWLQVAVHCDYFSKQSVLSSSHSSAGSSGVVGSDGSVVLCWVVLEVDVLWLGCYSPSSLGVEVKGALDKGPFVDLLFDYVADARLIVLGPPVGMLVYVKI